MTFDEYFKQFLEDEGISSEEVWNMGLSEYNHLKDEAWKEYKKENKSASYMDEYLEV